MRFAFTGLPVSGLNMSRSVPGHDLSAKERTVDVITKENVGFKDLLLSPSILTGLQKARFERPSPIQLKAIPYGRCGLDLIVQAKSGTGKTCVFTVIALEAISVESSSLQVIVLAPTREIAIQIEDVISAVGQDIKNLKVCAFIGGRPVADDKIKAKGCHIAVGSPGRLFQLIELDVLKCQNVRVLVLDEADKLLEENFQSQINSIYSMLPPSKQMIAASATYPEELAEFVTRYMRDPTFVRLNPSDMALLGVKQYYYLIETPSDKFFSTFEKKIDAVITLLGLYPFQQALIFSNYHSHAKDLSDACNSAGLPATYISGNLEQERRLEAMKMLKDFKCRVLISTDLTARGIDAHNVDLVVNLDVPLDWETYMHRTGRAGRFGSRGGVISIVMDGKEKNALFSIAETCAVSIFPVILDAGRISIDENASKIAAKSPQQARGNAHVIAPTAPRKPASSLKDNDTLINSDETKNTDVNSLKIPSLPELMLHGKSGNVDDFSYTFSDLLENFLHYKEHKIFKELPRINRSPKQNGGDIKPEENSDLKTDSTAEERHPHKGKLWSTPGNEAVHTSSITAKLPPAQTAPGDKHERKSKLDPQADLMRNSSQQPRKLAQKTARKGDYSEKKTHMHSGTESKPMVHGAAGGDASGKGAYFTSMDAEDLLAPSRNTEDKKPNSRSRRKNRKDSTTRTERKRDDEWSSEADGSDEESPEFLLPRFAEGSEQQRSNSGFAQHREQANQAYPYMTWAAYRNWCRYWYNVQNFYMHAHLWQ